MVRRSRGLRSGTRKKLAGGRFSIAEALQDFKPNDQVIIKVNPSVHRGMPQPRFQGRLATVVEKRGNAFVVEIKDGNKTKQLISKPEHLRASARRSSLEGLKKD